MLRLSHKTRFFGAAGALGGSAAWIFILLVSAFAEEGLLTEIMLGALAGAFIGGFIWSHEAIAGRQLGATLKRAFYGAVAGLLGGAAGAGLGNTIFTMLGMAVVESGGLTASLGMGLSVALGWAMLGATVGLSGGLMIRSRERALYGFIGGSLGGLFGGAFFYTLSATSIWSTLAGLALLGMSIGAFISLVEEALISATVTVIKGRHIGRVFPLLKEMNVLGRDDRSDVCLSGAEGVNVQHAVIKRSDGHFSIETEEQGKAVYVNQKMTRSSRLTDGDVIRVGSILLQFSVVKQAVVKVPEKAAAVAGVVAIILLGVFSGGGTVAQAGEPASVQITQFDLGAFPQVRAYLSCIDVNGKPVLGLSRGDITITENNYPVLIDSMQMAGTKGLREPLNLAIVLDRSKSMTGENIERAKESVLRFISLMEPGDRAALFVFSDEVDALESLTGSRNILKQAVLTIQPRGHTALFDGIARGVESVSGVSGRKAVIVLTDGIANRGALGMDQAIEAAVREYVSVTVIGLGKNVRKARLERITQETGGSYFFAPEADDLSDIYLTISNRMRNEYVITYQTGKRAEYLRNVSLAFGTGPRTTRAYFQPESSLFGTGGATPGWAFIIPLMSLAGFVAISIRKMDRQYQSGHLSLVRGRGSKKDIDISSTVTIVRDERNMLGLFKDNDVAQQHAEVIPENGRYMIEDKGSGTGTFVNKKRVTGRQALEDGDVIDMGRSTIVFSEGTSRSCSGCGASMRINAKFCAKCGVRVA
jgi:VWFA-related protein